MIHLIAGDCKVASPKVIVGCRAKVFFKFQFKLMQKFCFQYQFEGFRDIELYVHGES